MSSSRSCWIIGLSALVAAGACGTEPTSFLVAVVEPACAPDDGPAVLVTLATAGTELQPPLLQVYVYRTRTDAASRTWSVAPPFTDGQASYCATMASFESATSGSVRLGPTLGAGPLNGSVDVEFPTRGRIRGAFEAVWRDTNTSCG
jgi:hypothetical protein